MTEPIAPKFENPKNIIIGKAKVIYAPWGNARWGEHAWHMPGMSVTMNYQEAYACAVEMNRLMGGVEVIK